MHALMCTPMAFLTPANDAADYFRAWIISSVIKALVHVVSIFIKNELVSFAIDFFFLTGLYVCMI